MTRAARDICTRTDEMWADQQAESQSWQDTFANDPEYLRWLEWVEQLERQRAERIAAACQAEIERGDKPL